MASHRRSPWAADWVVIDAHITTAVTKSPPPHRSNTDLETKGATFKEYCHYKQLHSLIQCAEEKEKLGLRVMRHEKPATSHGPSEVREGRYVIYLDREAMYACLTRLNSPRLWLKWHRQSSPIPHFRHFLLDGICISGRDSWGRKRLQIQTAIITTHNANSHYS